LEDFVRSFFTLVVALVLFVTIILATTGDAVSQETGKPKEATHNVETVAELVRPQNPKKPYPYREEDVTWESKAKGVTLAGTLTSPHGDGPFPAVILISGSGPQDRDGQLLGHRPFFVLADHLTRAGIAVLRYDDRGVGKSKGKFETATALDFVDDALSGAAFLKTRPKINSRRIGLVGHSEGGLVAPIAATRSTDVAYIVLLAGPGKTGAEILEAQNRQVAKNTGRSDEFVRWQFATLKRTIAIVLAEKDNAVASQKINEAMRADLVSQPVRLKLEILGHIATTGGKVTVAETKDEKPETLDKRLLEATIPATETFVPPSFRFFVQHDPRTTLEKVQCPVLALNGENDQQVPAKAHLSEIRLALEKGGNRHATVEEMPGLNHLFQTCKTGLPAEYGTIEETFAPAALKRIARWINDQQ
jgi:pimeloyl-ACP methyl ester carboxylesterase